MEKLCKTELCTGCGACAAICPMDCITMEADKEGFLRPAVQAEKCIDCSRCRQVCPILTESSLPGRATVAYAAVNADEQVRFSSTSGGIFSLLCNWVLERNGVIFGAAYDNAFHVVHCLAQEKHDLHKIRGAKYAQSRLDNTFHQVREHLKDGKYVLFSGTPCQIGGLVSFLGKDYAKLILVDLICHGVPSPMVWQHYIDYRSARDADGKKPVSIHLRSKETGWPGYSIRFEYPDGTVYSAPNSQDPYLRGFVRDLYLRQSCYDCHFKGRSRQSDFTLGDYWGVWSQMPEYHDGKGTSLVLIHTEKGKKLWEQISPHMRFGEAPANALADNPSALTSSALTGQREQFFARFRQEDFHTLIDALCPKPAAPAKPSVLRRSIRKIRSILKDKLSLR